MTHIPRTVRVSEVIRRELCGLFQRETELEGVMITISEVTTSSDLKEASVFISLWENEESSGRVLDVLNEHRKEWQTAIGRKLGAKFTPRLTFRLDDSLARGDRVLRILQELQSQHLLPEERSLPEETEGL
ncbi:30S ribosome-binding factor RbfA [Candidatus Methylacidithermus pantelleriae]|uniref:Ribosome-binding factor A n=1 Tax=Candidatus Methylacidithermus pantelleriae TaxID=2744239 RepID=A0A8J2FNV5_9BACT|nr:30S ribosome-binding factor RbfA [Candidatus Methylacidithermus pantelleriae]CAF0695469.1 Ribosome-binding factor A [Candidatus Methylacidithermus pantelleriae]